MNISPEQYWMLKAVGTWLSFHCPLFLFDQNRYHISSREWVSVMRRVHRLADNDRVTCPFVQPKLPSGHFVTVAFTARHGHGAIRLFDSGYVTYSINRAQSRERRIDYDDCFNCEPWGVDLIWPCEMSFRTPTDPMQINKYLNYFTFLKMLLHFKLFQI